jgi:hypothetical protein
MKFLEPLYIVCEPKAGASIDYVMKDALEVARKLNLEVRFKANGRVFRIDSDSDLDGLYKLFLTNSREGSTIGPRS